MNDQFQAAATAAVTQAAKDQGQKAAMGFFEKLFAAYQVFIDKFPPQYQWVVSLIIGLAIAAFLWNLIRKNWLWIVLAILLFPGILPILKNFFDSISLLLMGKQT